MGFRKCFLLAALIAVAIGIYLLSAYGADNTNTGEKCLASLKDALLQAPSIKEWPLTAQWKVEVDTENPLTLKVSARAISGAYSDLISSNEESQQILMKKLSERNWTVVKNAIRCTPPYDEESFGQSNISRIMVGLNIFSFENAFTPMLRVFLKRFDVYFYEGYMYLGTKLRRERKFLPHEILISESYNKDFNLEISTNSYALMWNPNEITQLEVNKKLLEGAMDPQKRFRFTVLLKLAGKTGETENELNEITDNIDAAAKEAANAVLAYLKAVSEQVEI